MVSLKDLPWSVCFTMVLLVALLQPVTSLKHKNMMCEQLNQCVCQFPSGLGLNLTNLGANTLKLNGSSDGSMFYFNPCREAENCSRGSLICLESANNQTMDLGGVHQVAFLSQGIDNPIFLSYDNGEIKTEIQLECSDKNETSFLINTNLDELQPSDQVKYSKEACLMPLNFWGTNIVREGLSNGALFVIVLLVLWCSYILVGAAAKHFLQGATGWEMIPHYEFWRNVPNSFMSCTKYIANGCRSPPSYEQI